jgi:hypothetical protein
VGTSYVYAAPSTGPGAIGSEASGNQGLVIGGPATNGFTWWEVAFNDNLTGWTYQGNLALAPPTAPTLSLSANPPSVATGASSTLSWSSTNATSCSGTGAGFSPSGVSGQASVSPPYATTYSITCSGTGGSTTRTAAVIVNPAPSFTWSQSLPVPFNASAIVPFGGTETRSLLFMDGSLYAGIGDWMDPDLGNAGVSAAQVARLDSSTGSWVQDQNFLAATTNRAGNVDFQAVAGMGTAHFDHDVNKNPITPVDVLMAGFWNLNIAGLQVAQKTVTTGSTGAQGTWTLDALVAPPANSAQIRAFTSYTDSVTGQEMAFAGSDQYGIFSGAFNASAGTIQWNGAFEAGSETSCWLTGASCRTMSFAACGGKLYASYFDSIEVRTDGPNPSWKVYYQYPGSYTNTAASGFRGLTCVPQPTGPGYMLIASLEGPGDIYDIPVGLTAPIASSAVSVELVMSNFLATQLGYWASYSIPAYNNMVIYPGSGTSHRPDILIGVGVVNVGNDPNNYQGLYPNPTLLVRHANGSYDFQTLAWSGWEWPATWCISTRAVVFSEFPGDPAGTIYTGGYDAHSMPAHNTDWVYRGVPKK